MGRKIPAKKHRGVKDPLQQQARRLQSIKSKINAPPKDPDEQPVPRSLTRLFAFQEKKNEDQKSINKRKQNQAAQIKARDNVSSKSDNPISRLRKLPGESGRGFSLRINSAIKALHDPVEQQNYPDDIDMEDYKGERMAAQRERRARKLRRGRPGGTGARGPGGDGEPQLSRTQKLARKKKEKKIKAEETSRLEGREVVHERVPFGAVAHAPPALHFANKRLKAAATAAAAAGGAPRPGRRDLLLTSMLSGSSAGGAGAGAGASAGAGAGAGAGSVADQLRRERARNDAIAAYRALKASKHKQR